MVISISNVSPGQGMSYYTGEGYRSLEAQQQNSRWTGKLTAWLGVSGNVDPHPFALLLQGKHPAGEVLVEKQRLHSYQARAQATGQTIPVERAGFDLTTSAPKSVSLQALVFRQWQIEEAHRQATDRTLQFLEERYALITLRHGGQRTRINTEALAIAQFHHDTSRALDPQLHTHNVILNLQQRPDGKWQSLDNEAIYRARSLLGRVYRNELAVSVRALGYEIELTHPTYGFWEIKGHTQEQLEQFSKRSQSLKTTVGEAASSQLKAWVVSHSNRAKKQALSRSDLIPDWEAEAQAAGIQPSQAKISTPATSEQAEAVVQAAIRQCADHSSQFRREDLERVSLNEIGQISISDLSTAIATAPNLTRFADPKGQIWYTLRSQGVLIHDAPGHSSTSEENSQLRASRGEVTTYFANGGHSDSANSPEFTQDRSANPDSRSGSSSGITDRSHWAIGTEECSDQHSSAAAGTASSTSYEQSQFEPATDSRTTGFNEPEDRADFRADETIAQEFDRLSEKPATQPEDNGGLLSEVIREFAELEQFLATTAGANSNTDFDAITHPIGEAERTPSRVPNRESSIATTPTGGTEPDPWTDNSWTDVEGLALAGDREPEAMELDLSEDWEQSL